MVTLRLILKRTFGVLGLLMGTAILIWFIYNQFSPTPEFERSFKSIFQLGVPLLMIGFGWVWLTEKRRE